LPFEADRFDIVLVESVLIFVADKAQAIRECVRVTRPGGYVGLSEGFATKQPPPELAAQIRDAIGPAISTLETWRALWDESGLQDRLMKACSLEPRKEIKDRMQWIGWRWLLRAWGRSLRLYITNPGVRQSIKKMFDVPPEANQYIGYGLFVGRK
jgi:SAM-dependent methyltransferase